MHPDQTGPKPFVSDPNVRIGHVHRKGGDLGRALGFYSRGLGWEIAGGLPPQPGTTGLYHTAILYPTRAALAEVLHRVLSAKIRLEGAADHGVSESIYLRDPDGNGVELYRDRPESEWPRAADGTIAMSTRALDLESLLAEAE